jgi:tRNA pseudouridine32 synthase/23S rRNA pseudouridine746 synthase
LQIIKLKRIIGPDDPETICDALALHSGLPKGRIKKAIDCGAVWLQKSVAKTRRIRRSTTRVMQGDRVSLYYDESILSQVPPRARCIRDMKAYSVWFKPANLMTQGTRFGDHGALTRQVERYFAPRRKVFLVHRLDRETSGLVILAHSRRSAASLSEMFRARKIQKTYQAWVLGDLGSTKSEGTIDLQLDARRAVTHYALKQFDRKKNQSLVRVTPVTGRRHQIRRHFDRIGHPVMGDPRYGSGNKNKSGLRLTAVGLAFECPLGNGAINIKIDRTDVK